MSQGRANKTDGDVSSEGILHHPVPEFLLRGRNNPINGTTCFFSESTFRRVVGPEMTFRDKFLIHAARAKEARQKTEKKKKRQKDLDLPSQKVVDIHLPKSSSTEIAPPGEVTVKLKKPDAVTSVSSDDDGSEADLVIADEEEHEPATVQSSKMLPDFEDSYLGETFDKNETGQTVEENADQESAFVAEPSNTVVSNAIPLYATGITSHKRSSLPVVRNKNGDSMENSSSTNIVEKTRETISDVRQEDKAVEEGLCLVMPPLTSESDDNDGGDNDKLEPVNPSGSSLPLIPALMSEPIGVSNKTRTSQNLVDLMKPMTTSLFYKADQSPAHTNVESTANVGKPYLKPGPSIVSTVELEVDTGDVDVPIFSLAGTKDATILEADGKRSLRNKGIWSCGLEDHQKETLQKAKSKDNSAKNALKFRQSSLTRSQMSTYLELFEKYARPYLHGGQHPMFTEKQKRQMADFETLQTRVLNEQREFQSYLQQNAIRNPQFYTFIRSHAKHYAYTKVQSYRPPKNLIIKFSNRFTAQIPLEVGAERVELTFEKHLLEMGLPPRVALPDLMTEKNSVQVPHHMQKIELNFPSCGRNQEAEILHHESISEDQNAETLAVKYKSVAVLSSSVIKCLLDNRAPDYKRPWNIPVTVKEHHSEDGRQKVVYLNKPIYEDNLLLRDCNALFHKYALRSMVSLSKHPPMYRSTRQQRRPGKHAQKRTREKTVDDPFDMFATDLEALETFGKTSLGRKDESLEAANLSDVTAAETNCRRSKRIAEAHSEKDMSHSDSTEENVNSSQPSLQIQDKSNDVTENLTPNLNERKGSLGKRSLGSSAQRERNNCDEEEALTSPAKKPREETDVPNLSVADKIGISSLDSNESPSKSTRSKTRLSSLSPLISSTKKSYSVQSERQQTSFFPDVQRTSSSSNPLDLILGPDVPTDEKKTNLPAAKENPSQYLPHSEPLSSLLYSQWRLGQTNILIRSRSHGTFKTRNVYLTAKMEYQATHGVEQVTAEEMVRDWAACYIRPNSKLVRARINAFTSEILMFEELECHQILKPSSSFRPTDGFTFINNLLAHLSSLNPGNYLVSHEPGKNFCGIRTLKHGARLDNIEKPLPIPPEKKLSKDTVPWIPIDPTLLLPYHTHHQRIPATFLPRDVVITPGSKKPPQATVAAKLKNKKNKKKKKNKFKNKGDQDFF